MTLVVLLPTQAGCETQSPVGAHALAVEEIERLDDHDPLYEGHMEPAVLRPTTIVDRELIPDGPCPEDAPLECGMLHCCPAGLDCVSGAHGGVRYCANRADGSVRQPCEPRAGSCEEGLQCRITPTDHAVSPRGPHVCTRPCGAAEDCTDLGDGFCCLLGWCHHVEEACADEMVTRYAGTECDDDGVCREVR